MSSYKFKGVFIPKSVWLDERLSPTQKFLLCEIDALSDGINDPCIAGNAFLQKHLHVSRGTLKNMITFLIKLGYVKRSYSNKKLSIGRKMWTNLTPSSENDTPSSENDTPSSENDTPSSENDTIKSNLNTSIKEEEEDEKERQVLYIHEPLFEVLPIHQNDSSSILDIDLSRFTEYLLYKEQRVKPRDPIAYKAKIRKSMYYTNDKDHAKTKEQYLDFCNAELPAAVNIFDMYEEA